VNGSRAPGGGQPSLRGRLLLTLLSVVGVVWIAVGVITYRDAQLELDALLDAHLIQSASLLAAQSAHELAELHMDATEAFAPYRQKVVFQVWDSGKGLLLKSADAPATRLSAVERGLSDAVAGSTRWRVYSAWDADQRMLVQVAEDHAVRDRLATRIALHTTLPLLLSLPLLAAAMGWAVNRTLRPIAALARQVEGRRTATLDPITTVGVPQEIRPLIEGMNELLARVRRSFEQERRFTANAAHELRTPLAALRVQAELAQSAGSTASAAAALQQVIVACDRLTRLVSQLLVLARVEEQSTARAPCRLDTIAREVIAAVAPRALESRQEVSLDAPQPIEFEGSAPLLAVLLRNLIDNALAHGGSPLRVDIALRRAGDQVVATINDDGRGIPPEALAEIGTRFFRPEGTRAEGSGLGLALVRRIAEWHGGTLQLAAGYGGRGVCATVTLPVPAMTATQRTDAPGL
jgi:two-component system, OmpR family, sensor histidine kinase QseC